MKSFSPAALALLLPQVAMSTFLRTSTEDNARRLSNRLISGYEPVSEVVDHGKIDLDQQQIEIQLKLGSDDNFGNAESIYTKGAHSKTIARVTLTTGLLSATDKNSNVVGKTDGGGDTHGYFATDYKADATTVDIRMDPGYACHVGGSPVPVFTECFAPNGNVTIGNRVYEYNYVPLSTGAITNGRTIQKFSTAAADKMLNCGDQCPYKTFEKFYNYYGRADYADHWIMSAFQGKSTSFTNGNADFSRYQKPAKAQAIKKGTAYMSIWMYVIRELEDAIDDCNAGCGTTDCNDEPGVHAWDEAVAFYSGTLEGEDGDGSGVLLSELADKRAANFKTAGDLANEVTGRSHVNLEVFRQFSMGKNNLQTKKCEATRRNKERIEELMAIPLIQGTLRYAWKTDYDANSDEVAEAEGAVFAAAVLPLVHAVDEDAAEIIYNNMRVGQSKTADFLQVKGAFESVYTRMNVRCEDVGGLWDDGLKGYVKNAEPCTGSAPLGAVQPAEGGDNNAPLIIGIVLASVVGAMVIAMIVFKFATRSQKEKEPPVVMDGVNGSLS